MTMSDILLTPPNGSPGISETSSTSGTARSGTPSSSSLIEESSNSSEVDYTDFVTSHYDVFSPEFAANPAYRSISSEISTLVQEIHRSIFEEHKTHPKPSWARQSSHSCFVSSSQSAPTCTAVLSAFNIDASQIPEMLVKDVVRMVKALFGRNKRLHKIFETENIDGSVIVQLSLNDLIELLKLPIGPAVTLDGILKKARELQNIPHPLF